MDVRLYKIALLHYKNRLKVAALAVYFTGKL